MGPLPLPSHDDTTLPVLAAANRWEPKEEALARSFVGDRNLVVDVGVHCGYFTMALAKAAAQATVLSIEAEPPTTGCSVATATG